MDKRTYQDIGEKQRPLEFIPTQFPLRPFGPSFSLKPHFIIVVVALTRNSRLTTAKRLHATSTLRNHWFDRIALLSILPFAGDPPRQHRSGKLLWEVVHGERDIATVACGGRTAPIAGAKAFRGKGSAGWVERCIHVAKELPCGSCMGVG
jgi:hypothetical protein